LQLVLRFSSLIVGQVLGYDSKPQGRRGFSFSLRQPRLSGALSRRRY
jgi:hypothetical protein